ncbi:uncharacterized protein LOC123213800 isoform X2 [Mangifera indica]|uniref:uncharacterized protein LOC123213800 isoform X2 n=1 Tax=Mangifera indica TaxID=29780 RepID=UPI001CFABD5D|nr:uncharacterized protein LOC123213800 isoform X2 [Mangifera indica]
MSRREGRDSESRRHRSRFDREPSPKKSRRDGKPAAERVPSNNNLDFEDHVDQDQTRRRRLQDVLPLEAQSAPDTEAATVCWTKEADKKSNALHEKNKDPTDHDERGNAGQVGRSFSRGAASDRELRRDSRSQRNERAADKKEAYDTRPRDEKSHGKVVDNSVWCHDEFFKLETDPPPPAHKRRAFREEKISLDSGNVDKAVEESAKVSRPDRPVLGSERREQRGRDFHHSDRVEKPPTGDRLANRGETQRVGYLSRLRDGSGGGRGDYRGRDRFEGRQGFRPNGTRGEKWKHDMFQDANRSPTPKDEEDQIAKVEALLAS